MKMAGVNNRVKSTNDLELKDRLVAINRVTKVTKGGRTFSFAAIVVVGNEDGIIGWGLGKAGEVTTAIAKGVEAAKKNLIKVPVHKGTIPHEQLAKFGGAQVLIRPASHGTGVKAGGAMRAVLESVGITDVLDVYKRQNLRLLIKKLSLNLLNFAKFIRNSLVVVVSLLISSFVSNRLLPTSKEHFSL